MAGVLSSVAAYETELGKERQLAGLPKPKRMGTLGRPEGRPGIRFTEEEEKLIRHLHVQHKPVAAIARLVGLTRKTVYAALRRKVA